MKSNRQARRQAKQLFRLCQVNQRLDEGRTRQVVQHLLAAGYRDCPALLAHFLRLVRLDRALHTARIESAVPLPAEMQTAVRKNLVLRYGDGLAATFDHNPALIGGMRIQVGSDVYDGSVLAGLAALESRF